MHAEECPAQRSRRAMTTSYSTANMQNAKAHNHNALVKSKNAFIMG